VWQRSRVTAELRKDTGLHALHIAEYGSTCVLPASALFFPSSAASRQTVQLSTLAGDNMPAPQASATAMLLRTRNVITSALVGAR
jgi:hypothetical protein